MKKIVFGLAVLLLSGIFLSIIAWNGHEERDMLSPVVESSIEKTKGTVSEIDSFEPDKSSIKEPKKAFGEVERFKPDTTLVDESDDEDDEIVIERSKKRETYSYSYQQEDEHPIGSNHYSSELPDYDYYDPPKNNSYDSPAYEDLYKSDTNINNQSQPEQINTYGENSIYTQIGNTLFGSEGDSYTKIGNTVFGSDGSIYSQIGNTTFGSDGSSYTQIGNTTFGNDGTSYSQIGNTTFGSDGSSYTQIGNTTFVDY